MHNQKSLPTETLPRDASGKLRTYTMVGSYPILYLDRHDSVLCADCANEYDGDPDMDPAVSADINWEYFVWCDACSCEIEPAYPQDENE